MTSWARQTSHCAFALSASERTWSSGGLGTGAAAINLLDLIGAPSTKPRSAMLDRRVLSTVNPSGLRTGSLGSV